MSAWKSGYVEANGLQLFYTRTGSDKPPVVLAHGFSDDGLCWTTVAEALEADYDVVMVDARGHGRSTGPEQGYTHEEQAADLAGAITALGLQQPAVLGHSMGAVTTLTLAGVYPDLARAILLEDPPAWWVAEKTQVALFSAESQAQRRAWITALKRKTHDELVAEQRAATPHWSDVELRTWADAKLRLSFNLLNRPPAPPLEWAATLQRITCPTLLITGDSTQGALVTAEDATAFEALVPHAQVAHIPAASHSIRRDQFERYIAIVSGFLAEQM